MTPSYIPLKAIQLLSETFSSKTLPYRDIRPCPDFFNTQYMKYTEVFFQVITPHVYIFLRLFYNFIIEESLSMSYDHSMCITTPSLFSSSSCSDSDSLSDFEILSSYQFDTRHLFLNYVEVL